LQSQEANYIFLLDLQQAVLKKMKAGVPVKEVYDFALSHVQSKKPELADKMVKSIGFGVSRRPFQG
jgi:nucleosome binding factor SPN SPT16 subunit